MLILDATANFLFQHFHLDERTTSCLKGFPVAQELRKLHINQETFKS